MPALPQHVFERFYDGLGSSSLEALVALFTEDAVFTFPAMWDSRTVRVQPAIRSVMSEMFALRPPDFSDTVVDIAAEGAGTRAKWIGSTGGHAMHGEGRFNFRGCIAELLSKVESLPRRSGSSLERREGIHAAGVLQSPSRHGVPRGSARAEARSLRYSGDEEAPMARRVVEMHFVCRDDLNVTDFGNGTFETGFWFVSAEAARTVRTVALHQDKVSPSYRQGQVIGRRTTIYEGKPRFIFRVRDDRRPLAWGGGGSGEKGYVYG